MNIRDGRSVGHSVDSWWDQPTIDAAAKSRRCSIWLAAYLVCLLLSSGWGAARSTAQEEPRFPIDAVASMSRFDFWDNQDHAWFARNVPVLETPVAELDEVWWYRWQLVTKHLVYGSPNDGWSCTEFIDRPFWSGTYGAISCPAGLQLQELRWMRDPRFARDYAAYWFRVEGAQPRRYSTWLVDATWEVNRVHPDDEWIVDLLDDFVANYEGWERERFDADMGMFWQNGHDDGMEININSRQTRDRVRGAPAYRPTLNAYLYADALAIARTARLAGRDDLAEQYDEKANSLRSRMIDSLWDERRSFFFPMARQDEELDGFLVQRGSLTYETGQFAGSPYGRELIGFVPWQFEMVGADHASAWATLFEDDGFRAPYGPTTVERRDPLFLLSPYCCVWSGQSWPYATSQTLEGLANLLQNAEQNVVDRADYWELLSTYVRTQHKAGRPYIAEAANPDTGSWEGHDAHNHSEHYFHSSFCDLVITGLIGMRPRDDEVLELRPLVPDDWDYFALQDLPYRGRRISLIWDRNGDRYGMGPGLSIWVDGELLAHRDSLAWIELQLPPPRSASPTERLDESRSRVNVAVNNRGSYYPRVQVEATEAMSSIATLFDGQRWDYSDPIRAWVVEPGAPSVGLEIDLGRERTIDQLMMNALDDGADYAAPIAVTLDVWRDSKWVRLVDQQVAKPGTKTDANPWAHRDVIFPLVDENGVACEVQAQRIRVGFERPAGKALALTEIGLWGLNPLPYDAVPDAPANLARATPDQPFPRVTASHTSRFDQIEMVNDGEVSFRPGPHNRWTSYESPNEQDWLMVEWEDRQTFHQVELGIYDDRGGVQAPESYRVEVRVDGDWQDVRETRRVPRQPQGGLFNTVEFEAVDGDALRVIFVNRGAARSGLTELLVR